MTPFRLPSRRAARNLAALACIGLVAACGRTPQQAVTRAPSMAAFSSEWERPASYDPPGPASDPWGPWIAQASRRFDVPERWIREVMRQESGGRQSATSRVGAMGLMQVMPGTYAELSRRYQLGGDPYHPWDNIMAGTAYIREMYELYGSPAFLAAYNAGPRRLEDYLWGSRGLPSETRNYVARIGPRIAGATPNRRAAPEVYAAAEIPTDIPAGPRQRDAGTMLALREQRRQAEQNFALAAAPPPPAIANPFRGGTQLASAGPVVAMAPIESPGDRPPVRMEPVVSAGDPGTVVRMDPVVSPGDFAPVQSETLAAPPAARPAPQLAQAPRAFSLIGTAQASTLPTPARGAAQAAGAASGAWGVQVGAFASENLARAAADRAREMVGAMGTRAQTERVGRGHDALFRARVTGLGTRNAAEQACDRLRVRGACMVIAPGA